MNTKKTKFLDITRFIIALLVLVATLLVLAWSLYIIVSAQIGKGNGLEGLIVIIAVPLMIVAFIYIFFGIVWIVKYNTNKHILLTERKFDIIMFILAIIAGIFLRWASIPLIVYYVLDLTELIVKKSAIKKTAQTNEILYNTVKANSEELQNQSLDEQYNAGNKSYCPNCGAEINANSNICKYCGKSITSQK